MSSGSFGVTGFSGVRLWGSSGSFGVAGFSGVRTGGRLVRSGSLGSVRCALCFVGYVQSRWVQWGAPWGVVWIVRCHWVQWSEPWGLLGLFGVAGFSGVCPGCHLFRSGSLGSVG